MSKKVVVAVVAAERRGGARFRVLVFGQTRIRSTTRPPGIGPTANARSVLDVILGHFKPLCVVIPGKDYLQMLSGTNFYRNGFLE